MDTLKTAVVVVLLLAVLYGVYVVLNKPGEPLPQAAPWQQQPLEPLQVDIGGAGETVHPLAAAEPLDPLNSHSTDVLERPSTSPSVEEEFAATNIPQASPDVSPPDLFAGPDPAVSTEQPEAPPSLESQWPTDTVSPPSDLAAISSDAGSTDIVPPAPAQAEGTPALVASPSASEGGDSTAATVASDRFVPIDGALEAARAKVGSEQWYDALWSLSLFYNTSDLSDEQKRKLEDWLDPLAAKVIYSREHLIEKAYTTQPGETLDIIAQRYGVPWQLLANINGLTTSEVPVGTPIKVVRGPLRAEVNLPRSEITVFAGKLYAGRFPIAVGQDLVPAPGEYKVREKLNGRTYYAGDGQTIGPGKAGNPYGRVWIDLGNELCIHGSPSDAEATDPRGCIRLSASDANDLYGILSEGSSVTVRR